MFQWNMVRFALSVMGEYQFPEPIITAFHFSEDFLLLWKASA